MRHRRTGSLPRLPSLRVVSIVAGALLAAVSAADELPPFVEVPSGAIEIAPDVVVTPDQFFSLHRATLGLGHTDRMVRLATYASRSPGFTIERYVQTVGRVPVLGSDYTLTLRPGGGVQAGVGLVVPDIEPAASKVRSATALTAAKRTFVDHYDLGSAEIAYDSRTVCTLVYSPYRETWIGSTYALVHYCPVIATQPPAALVVEVDALTARVLRSYRPLLEQQPTPGNWSDTPATGWTVHHDQRSFEAQRDADTGRYRLETSEIRTFDNRWEGVEGWDASTGTDFLDDDDSFDEALSEPGVSVHWGLQEAVRFFSERHDASCFAGTLAVFPVLDAFVGRMSNAAFEIPTGRFFFGESPETLAARVTLDLIGHEYGHCIDQQVKPVPMSSPAFDYGEGAAIGEGVADIAGVLLERAVLGETDWIVGSGEWPAAGRNLRDPSSNPLRAPDTYRGIDWQPTNVNAPAGSIHRNGAVLGKWFSLLAEPGTHTGVNDRRQQYTVKGVGEELASDLWTRALLEKATPTYPAARAAARQAAAELCGERSILAATDHDAWRAVGLEPDPYSDTAVTIPDRDALGVEPWPAKLLWPAHGRFSAERAWKVVIARSADLLEEPLLLETSEVGNQPGIGRVGAISVALEPDTQYFWTVRPLDSQADPACFRPVRKFHTAPKRPRALAPITRRGDNPIHPWDMHFDWTDVDGATAYEVEISTRKNFSELIYPRIRIEEEPNRRTKLHALIATRQYWRVRATFLMDGGSEHDTIAGPWSRTAQFTTSKPRAQAIQPADFESVFPWPVEFSWNTVRGAGQFLLETREHSDSDDWLTEVTRVPPFDGDETQADVDFSGDVVGDQGYDWRLRVIGPVPPGAGPPFPEEGIPAVESFEISSVATKVSEIAPDSDQCPAVGKPIRFRFTGVQEATGYNVRVYETLCKLVEGSSTEVECEEGDAMEPVFVAVDDGADDVEVMVDDVPSRPQAPFVAGYWWQAQAVGPDGLPGSYIHNAPMPSFPWYFLQPPPPKIDSPADGAAISADDGVELVWSTPLAHGNGFVLSIYGGESCDPDRVLVSKSFEGNAPGTSAARWPGIVGRTFSWRVRPWVFTPDGNSDACEQDQWSECRSFRVTQEPTEAPAETVACPASFAHGGNTPETHFISVGRSEGTFTLSFDHFIIPDHLRVFHDEALLWQSGCTGGPDSVEIPFSGANDWIRIDVEPNCQGDPETEWRFEVLCAD